MSCTIFQDPDRHGDDSMVCSFLAGPVDGVSVAKTSPNSLNIQGEMSSVSLDKYGMNIHILNVHIGDYMEYVPINTQNNRIPLLNIV